MDPQPRIRLLTRPGCHLCDDARDIVVDVAQEAGLAWCEASVDDDPALRAAYGEQVPVALVDGRVVDYWRIDPARLRAALTAR